MIQTAVAPGRREPGIAATAVPGAATSRVTEAALRNAGLARVRIVSPDGRGPAAGRLARPVPRAATDTASLSTAVIEGWLGQLGRTSRHLMTSDVVAVPVGAAPARVAAWPDRGDREASVLGLASRAVEARKYLVELPEGEPATRLLAVPLVLAGLPRSAIVARFPRPPGSSAAADLKDLLQASARLKLLLEAARPSVPGAGGAAVAPSHAADERDARAGASPGPTPGPSRGPGLPELLELLVAALQQRELDASAAAVVNRLAVVLRADRVSLGMFRGKAIELLAVSGSAAFDSTSALSWAVRDAMREAVAQHATLFLPEDSAAAPRADAAQRLLLRQSGCGAVLTVPFADGARMAGAVTFEWSRPAAMDAATRERCEATLALVGPVLAALQRAERSALARLREAARSSLDAALGPRRPLPKLAAAACLTLLVVASVLPGVNRVAGGAVLRGSVQRIVLAPVDGFIATAPARPGDVVAEGAVLARLDDQSLSLEVARWQADYDRVLNEYRAAMSELDSARVTVLRASLDSAVAQLELAEDNLDRSEIRAPLAGIVVSGDLSQSIGAPVQRGATLFELAPLDGYRVSVRVPEADVSRLAAAQRGRLLLEALPGLPLDIVVERITPVSEVVDGRNVFEVEARLLLSPAVLRPGMQGVAKFEVGQERLLWIWTHRALDWLRLRLWALGLWR